MYEQNSWTIELGVDHVMFKSYFNETQRNYNKTHFRLFSHVKPLNL